MQVFSFRKQDAIQNFDARENISQHDFKIIRVEESGDIDFVVYGYMNRGERKVRQELQFITITVTRMYWKKKYLFQV